MTPELISFLKKTLAAFQIITLCVVVIAFLNLILPASLAWINEFRLFVLFMVSGIMVALSLIFPTLLYEYERNK